MSSSLQSIENKTKSSSLPRPFSTSTEKDATINNKKSESLWIFGYGSLIWKPDFAYRQKLVGKINGFSRKFWQGSTDNRGRPGKPGRVATLVEDKNDATWGVAFEVMPSQTNDVLKYLDVREKGGYSIERVLFYPEDNQMMSFSVSVYIAGRQNEEYLGEAPLSDIAIQISQSEGLCGKNSDYLYELAHALRELHLHQFDDHIFQLESILKQLEAANNKENQAKK